ncbi:MAG: phage baseplate assembly protein V [Candidatus Binatia bacterium]
MSVALYDSIARIARHEAQARTIAAVGRVVSIFPADGGDLDHAVTVELRDSGLVLPRVPIAVGVLGFAAIPAVEDLVVVVFLDGDLNAPVVVGRLYHVDHNPPQHKAHELVLRLPSGEADPGFNLVINGKESSLQLTCPGEVSVEAKKEKVTLTVGEIEVSLDGAGGGRLEIKAGDASITMKTNGEMALATTGKLKLEGTDIEISASGKVKISGAQVDVN